jgi:hypothetical protein
VGTGFRKRSCSINTVGRDGDSKSYPAQGLRLGPPYKE